MQNKLNLYKGKRVLVTGNSGFKGAWLTIFLKELGAEVIGYSDKIKWKNSIFNNENIKSINHYWADIRDYEKLEKVVLLEKPDLIFHLAAQPLVIESYKSPFDTFTTNMNGTLNILNIVYKKLPNTPIVIVTSDKVYSNENKNKNFSESSLLNGSCPYSTSKAVCEMLANSYSNLSKKIKIRTVRAGNVIGGGDWSDNRIIPDLVKAIKLHKELILRNPKHTRPWSYVLDIVYGYLLIGLELFNSQVSFDTYNLAPINKNSKSVLDITREFLKHFNHKEIKISCKYNNIFQEKEKLSLNTNKIRNNINWHNRVSFEGCIEKTAFWYSSVLDGNSPLNISEEFVKSYFNLINQSEKLYA